MTARSYIWGHPVSSEGGGPWRYDDTGEVVPQKADDTVGRRCPACDLMPTWCERCDELHDACLGHVEGLAGACCGHGVEEPQVMTLAEWRRRQEEPG